MTARVATNTAYRNSVYYMQRGNARVEKASQEYNTGKKFQTAADSPANFATTMRLENDIAMYEQYNINAGYALDNLSLEETSLDSINTALDRASVLLQSAVNARNDGDDLTAIAKELTEIQRHVADLINTKTATGESIFAGSLSDIDAYICQDDGSYVCQADNGQRSIQASTSSRIPVSDSAKTIFENVATARDIVITGGDPIIIEYENYHTFETFYNQNYVHDTNAATEQANNTYTINKVGNVYTVTDANGTEMARSTADATEMSFYGIKIHLDQVTTSATFNLNPPTNDNILNTLGHAVQSIEDFNNGLIDHGTLNHVLAQVQISAANTKVSVNNAMTNVGARQNSLDNIIDANGEISDVKEEAKATISEVDLYEATTNLTKTQAYLQMAMTSFNYVTGTTLFDYIH